MTLAPRLALRYLFARKSHKVVNVISYISMAGVAIATMAIVVVLSVFNGFSDLARRHLAMIDPDAKVVPSAGKVMTAGAPSHACSRRSPKSRQPCPCFRNAPSSWPTTHKFP